VGIITRADFIRALGTFVTEADERHPASDLEIQKSIMTELAGQSWAPKGTIEVDVRHGVVQVRGALRDER
jgi:osmotically-inducible protein OsmY